MLLRRPLALIHHNAGDVKVTQPPCDGRQGFGFMTRPFALRRSRTALPLSYHHVSLCGQSEEGAEDSVLDERVRLVLDKEMPPLCQDSKAELQLLQASTGR